MPEEQFMVDYLLLRTGLGFCFAEWGIQVWPRHELLRT
jgi:hypothetical protein